MVKAIGERNEIECSFGTGKKVYRANDIRAKLPDTARYWTGMCYFVKNVMKFLRELCLALTEIWQIFIAIVTMRGYGLTLCLWRNINSADLIYTIKNKTLYYQFLMYNTAVVRSDTIDNQKGAVTKLLPFAVE